MAHLDSPTKSVHNVGGVILQFKKNKDTVTGGQNPRLATMRELVSGFILRTLLAPEILQHNLKQWFSFFFFRTGTLSSVEFLRGSPII